MNAVRRIAACSSVLMLVSCSGEPPEKAEAYPVKSDVRQGERSMNTTDAKVLFEDPLTGDWRENWFLDGKEATLEHRDGGLYFAAGTITKEQDREKYHAHHAVLWTKQVFEGDLAISFEMTRVDASTYMSTRQHIYRDFKVSRL